VEKGKKERNERGGDESVKWRLLALAESSVRISSFTGTLIVEEEGGEKRREKERGRGGPCLEVLDLFTRNQHGEEYTHLVSFKKKRKGRGERGEKIGEKKGSAWCISLLPSIKFSMLGGEGGKKKRKEEKSKNR